MKPRLTGTVAVCGAAAIAASATALQAPGRDDTTQDRTRTTEPRQQDDALRRAMERGAGRGTQMDTRSVLQRMVGMWDVDIQVNPALWPSMTGSNHSPSGDTSSRGAHAENRSDNRSENGSDNRSDQGAGNGGFEPQSFNRQSGANTTRHGNATTGAPLAMKGIAEISLVLDDTILRERVFVMDQDELTGMRGTSDASGAQNSAQGAADQRMGTGPMQALSFFSFNENDGTYSVVFMNSLDGSIHYDAGHFDATSNRIVFTGAGRSGAHPTSGDRVSGHSTTTGTSKPSGWSNENVRVVLEILGDDSHRVTMYVDDMPGGIASGATTRDSGSTTPGATTPRGTNPGANDPVNTPANTPANTPDTGRPVGATGTADRPGDTGRDGATRAGATANALPPNAVYQATFTRVSDADAGRRRGLIEEAERQPNTRERTPATRGAEPRTPVNPVNPGQPRPPAGTPGTPSPR